MNKELFLEAFDTAISELEKNGDLVVTTTIPKKISEFLYFAIRDQWCCDVGDDMLPPAELRIESLLGKAIGILEKVFALSEEEAKSVAYDFYKYCAEFKSKLETADYFSHEGPVEIALTAYFCIKLGKDRFGESDYLDWRKEIYKEINNCKQT
jgi:hypothetical protein